jgi:hypothetical protein
LKHVAEEDVDEVNIYLRQYTEDVISQPIEYQILCSFWLCLHLENYRITKLLLDKYNILKKYQDLITTEAQFKKYINNSKLFGRKFNNFIFELALRLQEEYLAM